MDSYVFLLEVIPTLSHFIVKNRNEVILILASIKRVIKENITAYLYNERLHLVEDNAHLEVRIRLVFAMFSIFFTMEIVV